MTNQNNQCVNTIGFIFDTAKVKIKHRKKRVPKSSSSSSSSSSNPYSSSSNPYSSSSNPYYSSSSNPYYSSSTNENCSLTNKLYSLNLYNTSSYGSSDISSISSTIPSSVSSSSCKSDFKHHHQQKIPCLATSLFDSSSSTSKSCYYPKMCENNNNNLCNNLCITPICYEPSLCGELDIFKKKNKKKCQHKNKKKFKTDIFNKISKYCLIKVTKENFISSTLTVCTENKDECWIKFTENIYELLGGSFLITLSKCNIFRTLYCQLLKINYCQCCEEITLFFRYNILPPKNISQEDCLNNINNIDLYYKLENDIYHNLRFYYDYEYNFNPRHFLNI